MSDFFLPKCLLKYPGTSRNLIKNIQMVMKNDWIKAPMHVDDQLN